MKTLLCLTIALFTLSIAEEAPKEKRTIAIMEFRNHGPAEYGDFVRGVPDMMMTNIGSVPGLRVIERLQVEKAVKAFNMESAGLTTENSVKIGEWLGADILVFGSMIKSGRTIRFDARFIEASTGQQLAGSSVTGEENRVILLIDELCSKISERFTGDDKKVEDKIVPTPIPVAVVVEDKKEEKGAGMVRVKFSMYCSLMAEERFYHQKCKIYIDGREHETSGKIDRLNQDYELFNGNVAPGSHSIEVVHYYLNKNGDMARSADLQPHLFLVHVKPGKVCEIAYKLRIGMENQRMEY